MYKIHCHFSTRGEKKHKKERQSKPCMHLVTPRGTQCDTLCIIASIFSLIFATEWREKGRLCPRMAILSCKFVTLHVVQEVYATGLQTPVSG